MDRTLAILAASTILGLSVASGTGPAFAAVFSSGFIASAILLTTLSLLFGNARTRQGDQENAAPPATNRHHRPWFRLTTGFEIPYIPTFRSLSTRRGVYRERSALNRTIIHTGPLNLSANRAVRRVHFADPIATVRHFTSTPSSGVRVHTNPNNRRISHT